MSARQPNRTLLPAESWDYHPLRERFKENAISMGVAVGYGVALSQIFNPVVLGAAVLYATGKYLSRRIPELFKVVPNADFMPHVEEEKDIVSDYYQSVLSAYAQALKLPPQSFHFLKDSFFRHETPSKDEEEPQEASTSFKAVTENFMGTDGHSQQVFMSRDFLDRHPHGAVKFALAQGISHTKTKDTIGLFSSIKALVDDIKKPLLLGVYGSLLSLAVGGPLFSIFTQSVGLWANLGLFIASTVAANLSLNFVSRVQERRADRNAVFLTRNRTDAVEAVVNSNLEGELRPQSRFFEITKTHPTVYRRLADIKDAFNLARQYEPVKLSLPEPPKEVLAVFKPMDYIARGKRMRMFETSHKLHGF